MNKEESIKWFWNTLNYCYVAYNPKLPEILYILQDKSYIRYDKLIRLNSISNTHIIDNNIHHLPDIGKSELLIIVHTTLFSMNCSYDKIYQYLELNYSSNNNTVNNFIKGEIYKFNVFPDTPKHFFIDHMHLSSSSFSLDLKSSPELFAIDIKNLEVKYFNIKEILK